MATPTSKQDDKRTNVMDLKGRVFSWFMTGCLAVVSASVSDALSALEELKRFTFSEYHMGIDARLVLFAPDQATAEKAGKAAFDRIAELDSIMSDYRKDSELNRLCAKAGQGPVKVSADLFRVLGKAREISARSEGAFDVSVGPLITIWRAARKSGVLPDKAAVEQARKLVGWQKIKLDSRNRTVELTTPGMKLDLGGIAKGYAGDEAIKVLRKFGIKSAMVEMGGDLVFSNRPPHSDGWVVRIPNAGEDHGPVDLKFKDCAVSTSGDTEQFAVIGGVQYSHVVDPRTGWALTNRVQATVVSKSGLDTDPISTTITVLDEQHRAAFLSRFKGLKTYIRTLKRT